MFVPIIAESFCTHLDKNWCVVWVWAKHDLDLELDSGSACFSLWQACLQHLCVCVFQINFLFLKQTGILFYIINLKVAFQISGQHCLWPKTGKTEKLQNWVSYCRKIRSIQCDQNIIWIKWFLEFDTLYLLDTQLVHPCSGDEHFSCACLAQVVMQNCNSELQKDWSKPEAIKSSQKLRTLHCSCSGPSIQQLSKRNTSHPDRLVSVISEALISACVRSMPTPLISDSSISKKPYGPCPNPNSHIRDLHANYQFTHCLLLLWVLMSLRGSSLSTCRYALLSFITALLCNNKPDI